MNFKYLIVEHDGRFIPILFSTMLRHDDVANRLGLPIVSAGHVKLWKGDESMRADLCGRSGTLDMEPRPEDAAIILEDYRTLRGKASLLSAHL